MDPARPEGDPVVGFLVRRHAPGAPAAAGPCPDENLLAAMSKGWLLPEEREAVIEHLPGCESCRSTLGALSGGEAPALPRAPSRGRVLRVPIPSWLARRWREARAHRTHIGIRLDFAAAALLLVVAGALVGPRLLAPSSRIPGSLAGDVEGRLVASAKELARAHPELFGDFAPLSHGERLAPLPAVRAGATSLVYPAGRILETRPTFRWAAGPGEAEREIVLRAAGGAVVYRLRARASPLEYPADAPALEPGGQYSWALSGADERAFAVATDEERAAFESAVAVVRSQAPAAIRDLLIAHLALRRGLLGEAEKAVLDYGEVAPTDPVGHETLALVLRRLGLPEPAGPGSPGRAGRDGR